MSIFAYHMVIRNEAFTGPQEAPIVMAKPDQIKVSVIEVRAATRKELFTPVERRDMGQTAVTVATQTVESDPANRGLNLEQKKELILREAERLMTQMREVFGQTKAAQVTQLGQ